MCNSYIENFQENSPYKSLWSFQGRDVKSEWFWAKNQHTQRKLLNFENWSGENSKN